MWRPKRTRPQPRSLRTRWLIAITWFVIGTLWIGVTVALYFDVSKAHDFTPVPVLAFWLVGATQLSEEWWPWVARAAGLLMGWGLIQLTFFIALNTQAGRSSLTSIFNEVLVGIVVAGAVGWITLDKMERVKAHDELERKNELKELHNNVSTLNQNIAELSAQLERQAAR